MKPTNSPADRPIHAAELIQAIFRSAHYFRQGFETGFSESGVPSYLTGPRLRLLSMIADAGQIRMNDLAAKMGIKPMTVTQFVDALEKEGVLIRTPDPTDRRATLLQLTESAPPQMRKARQVFNELSENLLHGLSNEQRMQLYDILSVLEGFRHSCSSDEKNKE
ncbi:MarR family winged helix-turn-helix transcriptional regulator [Paenibacillus hexagrammi]|uniref:MarR family transcriptional regulator n=1 Tax=Paenibacillus hexagrammi TaxID=2908839 RepID=A0ABY3SM78_9BACL|nr:MarR family transcriptional regulator [Paenibacillus sp. YPD9-1]UJF35159.1 MarR family transcriptional regulator [Paenibacillus sp. YPD9-1]